MVGARFDSCQDPAMVAKLAKFTPRSLGQALRISGITPADVTVLAIHLSRGRGLHPS